MDDKDHRLLTLLRENARRPVSTLADALGVSRGTVQNRIDRMIERGFADVAARLQELVLNNRLEEAIDWRRTRS